jgi:hypothetical protein
MPLFIQKPQPVECRKVTAPTDAGDKALTDLCEWVIDHGGRADHDGIKIRFRSRSGWTSACIGDWIIANADGTFGVLRDEQFFKYYEPAPVDEKANGLRSSETNGLEHAGGAQINDLPLDHATATPEPLSGPECPQSPPNPCRD